MTRVARESAGVYGRTPCTPTFYGGPLDGRPARRHHGRWSTWLDDHGDHVPTRDGDTQLLTPTPLAERRLYLLEDDDAPPVYVWIPTWAAWRRQQRGEE